MLGKKTSKVFGGALASGLPYEDFEAGLEKPESVKNNIEHLRPMVSAVKLMADTQGWTDYVRPFLEKQSDPMKLLDMVKKKEDATFEAAKIEAYKGLLNYVNTLVRTAESLGRLEVAKKEDTEGEL